MSRFDYRRAPALSDYGITTGSTAEPKAFDAQTRDIPCQAACPTKTDVPGYIEKIHQNDVGVAYAINLEHNSDLIRRMSL